MRWFLLTCALIALALGACSGAVVRKGSCPQCMEDYECSHGLVCRDGCCKRLEPD